MTENYLLQIVFVMQNFKYFYICTCKMTLYLHRYKLSKQIIVELIISTSFLIDILITSQENFQ